MDYREAQLLVAEDPGAAGTKVIDINVTKPISQIEITYKVTKGSDGMSAGVPANITKIELVDGSKRLVSLNGYECQALGYYNRPGRLLEHGQELTANSEWATFPIDFGRMLWDPELAFDPTKFVNPQLRITYDRDVSDTSASAGELEVWARIFDELAISPIGFLSAIEHYDYTCGADNSYETIEIPDDREIRQILVRAYQDGYEPWYNIDEARLDEATMDKIAWEYTNLENYYRRNKGMWSPIILPGVWNVTTSERTFYVPMTDYWVMVAMTGHGTAGNLTVTIDDLRGGKVGAVSSATGEFGTIAMGWLPWHTYQFNMGPKDMIDRWYNPQGKRPRLRLRASTGATSATGEVVLEELYRY